MPSSVLGGHKFVYLYDISVSHGGEDVDVGLRWVVTLCGLVGRYCINIPRGATTQKMDVGRYCIHIPRGVTTQKMGV
jgi:hypothetical protein